MSGGRFNYTNDCLSSEMFSYLSPSRGQSEFDLADQARRINPLKDRQVSELCWDLLCLIHSFDWMISGIPVRKAMKKISNTSKRNGPRPRRKNW